MNGAFQVYALNVSITIRSLNKIQSNFISLKVNPMLKLDSQNPE